jgi:hypothetical protein
VPVFVSQRNPSVHTSVTVALFMQLLKNFIYIHIESIKIQFFRLIFYKDVDIKYFVSWMANRCWKETICYSCRLQILLLKLLPYCVNIENPHFWS